MKVANKHVEGLVKELAGEDTIKILRLLKNKKDVSEFKLADRLNINVNGVRNLLYKMNEHNLVTSIRKKDKKKGWYIYYWTFNMKRAKDLLVNINKNKLNQLKNKLSYGKTSYLICSNGCIKIPFEETLENDFKCTECGSLLVEDDSGIDTIKLSEEINSLEKQLGKQAN